jgi:hypothetical protein
MFPSHKDFSREVKEHTSRARRMAHRVAGVAMIYNIIGFLLFGMAIYVVAHFISKFW